MPATVKIYSTRFCPYCIRAKMLLDAKGIDYENVAVDFDRALREEMTRLSNRHTVPQIWIGAQHIGGFTDLAALEASGELDSLLLNEK